ncbi:enoyl-CoA hydratase-related protein [Streptosporangium sp. NPDC049644]|uniref:enoyl-CoA hydratase/isomerase family protein n=1 Tax=Streptosporangium sp. NPDC049644 TaxID=3155507 RepID=UPI00341BD262
MTLVSEPAATSAPVTLTVSDGVALIGLSRPEQGNAIDLPMARALRDTAAEVDSLSEVGAVVLFGHGAQFCVGGDLREFAAARAPGEFIAELAGTAHEALLGLRALTVPLVSAVHGACAGGGIGFALAADIVLAERTSRFLVAYTAAGLSPDCGVSWQLTRRLGPAVAGDLILTNRPLNGEEAARLGLVSRAVEPGTAYEEALRLARSLADGPREALTRSRRLIHSAAITPLEQHLQHEAESITALIQTLDGSEGVAAFLAKRRPNFTRPHRGVRTS